MPPPSTTRRTGWSSSSRRRAQPSGPSWRHGGMARSSVRRSRASRAARPASVRAPSASSQPRDRRPAAASAHSSSDQPRYSRRNDPGSWPAAAARTWASQPPTPSASREATWPSPRNSRYRVAPCHRARWGSSGHPRAAWAANRGRPERVLALHGLAGEGGGLGRLRRVGPGPQQPAQGGAGAREPGLEHLGRGREPPGVGDGPADHAGVEVVEGGHHHLGRDRAHGGGAGGEVAHPAAAQPGPAVGVAGLGVEVDGHVEGLKGPPHPPGRPRRAAGGRCGAHSLSRSAGGWPSSPSGGWPRRRRQSSAMAASRPWSVGW